MYCKPMVKRKKTEETKSVPQTAVMDTLKLYNDIHVVCTSAKETHVVFTAATPKSTLHHRSKFNIDVLPRQTYCRYNNSRLVLALSESLRTDFRALDYTLAVFVIGY